MAIDLNITQSGKVAERTGLKRVKAVTKRDSLPVVIRRSVIKDGPFDADKRRELISEAAYHRAALRGFESGHELDDWLTAEREVDERLCGETHPF